MTMTAILNKVFDDPHAKVKKDAGKRAWHWTERDYLVLDTETTGLSATSRIVEISIIDRAGDVLLDTLVNPGPDTPIEAGASRIHGITDADVRDYYPTFLDLWPQVKEIIVKHDIVLAYNTNFDFRLMAQSLEEDEAALSSLKAVPSGCIMELYATWWGKEKPGRGSFTWQSLDAAMQQCGLTWEGEAHRALADCRAARAVLRHIAANQGC